ncbi:hypothetical protein G443_003928 [Actinoalloteichus cyanogriseus DSM 43889]|uniref:Uncharacterized protein n=1 Tax=Actinoalloteichus caeruleus DSM 43889 TaxID=1120930 RepID=A0ABT1JNE6_ACTCY|nr:hypothetical protein [Actinoalloteichus caeruleus DSM 43889]
MAKPYQRRGPFLSLPDSSPGGTGPNGPPNVNRITHLADG